VAQRSTGSSLRSGSISVSPARFNFVSLRFFLWFPHNLEGRGARVLVRFKNLTPVSKGLEMELGAELAQRTESEEQIAIFCCYLFIFL
jgi:hypothetical protein